MKTSELIGQIQEESASTITLKQHATEVGAAIAEFSAAIGKKVSAATVREWLAVRFPEPAHAKLAWNSYRETAGEKDDKAE